MSNWNPFNDPQRAKQNQPRTVIPLDQNGRQNWDKIHNTNNVQQIEHPVQNPVNQNIPDDWKKVPEGPQSDKNVVYPNSTNNVEKSFTMDRDGNILVSGNSMDFRNLHSLGNSLSERVCKGLEESLGVSGIHDFLKPHIEEIVRENLPSEIKGVPVGLGMSLIKKLMEHS